MKFSAKNQQKQSRIPKSTSGLNKAPGPLFKKATPISKAKKFNIKTDPFFKGVTNAGSKTSQPNEKGLNKLVRKTIESNLVTKSTRPKIHRRLSVPSDKNKPETPLKKVEKQTPSSEGIVKAHSSLSDADDDWIETPVEHDKIELVLPTKSTEIEGNDEEDPSSNTIEDESSSTSMEISDENESGVLHEEDVDDESSSSPTETSEDEQDTSSNNEIENSTLNQSDDGSAPPPPGEGENLKRAGVAMFSGISNLNPAVEGKQKRKRNETKLMNQLYQGDASVISKLPFFKSKVEELTACGKLGKSKSKLLNKYRKCIEVAEKIKAGDISFLSEKVTSRNADVGVTDENVKQEEEAGDVDVSEEGEKQKPGKTSSETASNENLKHKGGESNKKTRYVLFVGNLPYVIDQYRISRHFKKAGKTVSIRIPLNKETNQARGFAFIEFNNKESYEKALSMHHTFIEGRRINVLYTNPKEQAAKAQPAKKSVKAKNLKLAAMRKEGLLAGSVKESQKRSARRRANKNKASAAES